MIHNTIFFLKDSINTSKTMKVTKRGINQNDDVKRIE